MSVVFHAVSLLLQSFLVFLAVAVAVIYILAWLRFRS